MQSYRTTLVCRDVCIRLTNHPKFRLSISQTAINAIYEILSPHSERDVRGTTAAASALKKHYPGHPDACGAGKGSWTDYVPALDSGPGSQSLTPRCFGGVSDKSPDGFSCPFESVPSGHQLRIECSPRIPVAVPPCRFPSRPSGGVFFDRLRRRADRGPSVRP